MKAELKFDRPADIEATIAFTFTLEQWQAIDKALSASPSYGPTGHVKQAVTDLLRRACDKLHYSPEEPEA